MMKTINTLVKLINILYFIIVLFSGYSLISKKSSLEDISENQVAINVFCLVYLIILVGLFFRLFEQILISAKEVKEENDLTI